jgi:hypothetical protein
MDDASASNPFENFEIDDNYKLLMLARTTSNKEILSKLASSSSELIRLEVAKNENFKELEKLAKDKSLAVRIEVAKRAKEKVLKILAKDPFAEVRRIVARRTKSSEVLAYLAKDEDWRVRLEVAWNENKDFYTSLILAKDKNPFVREGVALTTKSKRIIAILSKDKEEIVKIAVCENKNTPIEVIEKIAQVSKKVAEKAILNPKIKPSLIQKIWNKSELTKYYATLNPNTPAEVIEKIYSQNKSNFELIKNISKHPNTSQRILYELSFSNDSEIRREIAKHKNANAQILTKLSFDNDEITKLNALKNPNLNSNQQKDINKNSEKASKNQEFQKLFR